MGSPNKNGSTSILAENFANGARDAGHTAQLIDVTRMNIHTCTGCVACGYEGPCVQKDDNEIIKQKLLSCDMVVFATPLYYYGMSAQLKTVVDRFCSYNSSLNSRHLKSALLAAAAAILGAMSISILTGDLELPEAMVQISLAMSHNFWGLITIVLVGPISEELLFREAIAGEMLRRGAAPWLAIGVSALAFSAAHLNLAQGCYAFPLGILLGIIYYKTGGIVLTSLLHILNNGIVAVQLYADGTEAIETSPAEWFGSTTLAQTFMVLFGALSIALMTLFWNRYNLCK